MLNPASRRRQQTDSTMREAICAGALAVLNEHSLAGATMDKIAAATGVAKGSLYNYFESKDELLMFVYEKRLQPLREANRKIAAGEMAAVQKIEAVIRNWCRHVEEHRLEFQVLYEDAHCVDVLRRAKLREEWETREVIERVIAAGVEARHFRSVNAQCVSELLLAMIDVFIQRTVVEVPPGSNGKAIDTFVTIVLHGLSAIKQLPTGARDVNGFPDT